MSSNNSKENKLKKERERKGWSQEDVAAAIGCDARSVRRWESGRANPRPYHIQPLCSLFDKSAEELGLVKENETDTSEEISLEQEHTHDVPVPSPYVETPPLQQQTGKWLHARYIRFLVGMVILLLLVGIVGGRLFILSQRPSSPPHPGPLLYTYDASTHPLNEVIDVKWSPHGDFLACMLGNSIGKVLTNRNGTYALLVTSNAGEALSWSPDGTRIASATPDKKAVQIWNPTNGEILYRYPKQSATITDVTWSHDGTRIAWSDAQGMVSVWTVAVPKLIRTYTGHKSRVWWIAWSPDSRYIASGGDDTSVQVWDAATGDMLSSYRKHTGAIYDVSWSPDGTRIASASADGTVQIWKVATGESLFTYQEHTASVQAAEWSRDGKTIASAGADMTIRLWNATTGKTFAVYRGHTKTIWALSWSPDDTRLASAGGDGIVNIWRTSLP